MPYRGSRLLFLSFLLLLGPCDNHRATSTPIKRNDAIKGHLTENLSSCEVVLQIETLPAGSFARRLFASLLFLLCTLLISLLKKKLLKIYQKIHNQDNRIRSWYLLFHLYDYDFHYSEVSKPSYSLFAINLNPLFITHYSASTPEHPPEASHYSGNRISVTSGKNLIFIVNDVFLLLKNDGNHN